MFEHLFSPAKIGSLGVPNRLVVPAMVLNYCQEDGFPTERYLEYHEAKAKGGWGLIITQDYAIEPKGKGYTHIPGLWADEQIEPHSELTRRVHRCGGRIAAQIYHAGRQTNHEIIGTQPVAPSPIPCPAKKEMPRELAILEIERLVERFGDCALRAKKAGFDALEIHGGHGYLIAQFLSAYSNKRGDKYGGNLYNRARFALEVIADVRAKVGEDFPLIFRFSGDEYIPGGRTIEETKAIAMMLQEAGVDALHITAGVYGSRHTIVPPARMAHGVNVHLAASVKGAVSVPVIAVGWINDPFIAEAIVASGEAAFVAMGRASLADPELPNKSLARRFEDIIYCIGCMQGCTEKIRKQGAPGGCMLNPRTGREKEYTVTPAEKRKRIFIAGGGVAGMEAAIVAAQRGHEVHLFEKEEKLGGQFAHAAVAPGKGEIGSFIAWQQTQLGKLGVSIHLGSELGVETVRSGHPDAVIVATGSKPVVSEIPGADLPHVVNAVDVLAGKVAVGERVVIVGGGMVGSETANHLANHDKSVTIVETQSEIATDEETNSRILLLKDLEERRVNVLTGVSVKKFLRDYVIAEREGNELRLGPADSVVLALGSKSDNQVLKELEGRVPVLRCIGDALEVRKALEGIEEGYKVALEI